MQVRKGILYLKIKIVMKSGYIEPEEGAAKWEKE
jgi:hypothetical protein